MTKALKRTLIVVLAIIFVEVVVFAKMVYGGDDAYADTTAAKELPVMEIKEAVYVPPIEVLTVPEVVAVEKEVELEVEVEAETEEPQTEEEVVSDEEELSDEDWYVAVAAEYGLVPYDGSGYYNANMNGAWHEGSEFAFTGGYLYKDASGFEFTWYSEKVLPGEGLHIPGRHVGDEGYIYDENGNLCLASTYLPKGTVVSVPFGSGTGVVYDSGCSRNVLDVYVTWES